MNDLADYRLASKAFDRLIRLRKTVIWSLTLVLLALLAGNLLLLSSGADIASRPIVDGGVVTIGIAYSVMLVIVSVVVAVGYTLWANKRLDPLCKTACEELNRTDSADDIA